MRRTSVTNRSRRKTMAALSLVGALAVGGCAAGGNNAGGEGGEVTADDLYALPEGFSTRIFLETGQALSESNPASYYSLEMIKQIEELSNGQIEVEVTSGYALHAANEVTSAVRDGVSQMAFLMPGIEPAGYDNTIWYGKGLSWAIDSHRPAIGELAAFASSIQSGMDNQTLLDEFERQGVHPIVPQAVVHSGYGLLCTTKTTGLDDIRGKITRTAGPNWQAEAEAVGFTTVALPPLEQFEALQRGVVDCVMGPLRDWYSIDLLTVANYLTLDDEAAFVGFPGAYIANQDWWDTLPPGAQNIIFRAVATYWIEYAQTQVNLDILAMKEVASSGTHEINPQDDDLRKELTDFQSGVRDDLLENPPAGADADELDKNLTELRDNFHTWFDRLAEDPAIGGEIPDTYAGFAEWAAEQPDERWVAPGYNELVWEEVFEPYLPNKP
jgi:TRAP-type C4-dicarboxylate transport system substrate-binding protein